MTRLNSEPITQVRIDPDALTHNYRSIQDLIGTKVRTAAVVKADAYGHGLETAARAFYEAGCRFFCIATMGEAERLRKVFGEEVRILKVVPSLPDQFEDVAGLGIEEILVSHEQRKEWSEWLAARPMQMRFHLKIDRGMGRLGFSYEEMLRELIGLRSDQKFSIVGVMSHLPASEEDPEGELEARRCGRFHTSGEIRRFGELCGEIETLLGESRPVFHLANSGGTLFHPPSHFDMVRVGLALYGADPRGEDGADLGLKPAMSLLSRLVQVRAVPTGATIGYHREFVAPKPMFVGVVPVGYADGFAWNLRSNAQVLVRGKRCSVLGRVSMNLISVDVSDCEGVSWGDPVILLGQQGEERITAEEIAMRARTIPYEVLTGMGRLAPRTIGPSNTSAGLPDR